MRDIESPRCKCCECKSTVYISQMWNDTNCSQALAGSWARPPGSLQPAWPYTQTSFFPVTALKSTVLTHYLLYILCTGLHVTLLSEFGVLPFFVSILLFILMFFVHEHKQMPFKAPARLSIIPFKQHNEIRHDIAKEMNGITMTT